MQSIGGYDIRGELARGGMGVVYKAYDRRLDRDVAVKVLLSLGAESLDALARFQQEAQAMARLRHRHIAGVHAVGAEQGRPFLVMDLLLGGTLLQRLRKGPLPEHGVAELGAKLARALAHAHARQVLHRDVKPSNVLLDAAGEPALADFGLARVLDQEGRLTMSGEIVGTPSYMAPEQATGERDRIGPATDVYGLGATLYHALTGRRPFEAPDVGSLLRQVLEEPPLPPSRHAKVGPQLEAIVLRCLAKEPRDRFPSANALAEALERCARPAARPAASPRSWKLVAAACAALGLGAASFAGLTRSQLAETRAQLTSARLTAEAQTSRREEAEARADRLEAARPPLEFLPELPPGAVPLRPEVDGQLTALLRAAMRASRTLPNMEPHREAAKRWYLLTGSVHAQLLYAETLILTGENAEARRHLADAAERAGPEGQVRVRTTLAICAVVSGGSPLRDLQGVHEAIGLDMGLTDSALTNAEWIGLGNMLAEQEALQAAHAVFNYLFNVRGVKQLEVYLGFARILIQQGQPDSAEACLDDLLRQDPENLAGLILRAWSHVAQGDRVGAEDDCRTAREAAGGLGSPDLYRQLDELERALGDL